MKYHVITPFTRYANFPLVRDMLEKQRPSVEDLQWYLLLNDDGGPAIATDLSWIHQQRFPVVKPTWEMWRTVVNAFVKSHDAKPEDRYCILHDDDFYEPDFFRKIDQVAGEIVICSMKRGEQTPGGVPAWQAHPASDLIAAPQNIVVCSVGAEQIIMSGRILKTIDLPSHVYADGMMIVDLVSKHGAAYAPDAWVWFNYLEPGRWSH